MIFPSKKGHRTSKGKVTAKGFILDCAKKALRWQAGLRRHTIQVDDHGWVYLEGGKGETILFVHGFGMEKDGWGLFPKAFSRAYHLVLPDLPGFGENSRSESVAYDVPSQVKRLNRFAESLGLKRPYPPCLGCRDLQERAQECKGGDPGSVRSRAFF